MLYACTTANNTIRNMIHWVEFQFLRCISFINSSATSLFVAIITTTKITYSLYFSDVDLFSEFLVLFSSTLCLPFITIIWLIFTHTLTVIKCLVFASPCISQLLSLVASAMFAPLHVTCHVISTICCAMKSTKTYVCRYKSIRSVSHLHNFTFL